MDCAGAQNLMTDRGFGGGFREPSRSASLALAAPASRLLANARDGVSTAFSMCMVLVLGSLMLFLIGKEPSD